MKKIHIPKIHDRPLLTFWFDEYGIMHAVAKNTPRTLENIKENFSFMQKLFKEERICVLIDLSYSGPFDAQARQFLKKEIPSLFKAIGIVNNSASPLSIMITTVMTVVIPSTVPCKVFQNKNEGIKWLKGFLKTSQSAP